MFFTNIIHRRLLSLLQPWLQDEPELELKLGFVNSLAIAKNLRLNTSALNDQLDESNRFVFKEISIEHFSFSFSNWHAPAFTIQVSGVHVTLSAREVKEGESSRRSRKFRDTADEEMKKRLSVIDPEGSALHDVLGSMLVTTPSRNRFKTSLLNLILKHFRIQMLGVKLQVQFPNFNDSFTYLSDIKELNAESQYSEHGCLFRGLVHGLILPSNEGCFVINGSGFEIGYKSRDEFNLVCSSNDLFTRITMNNLQLLDFYLRVPELIFLFSPVDFPVLSAFGKLSSGESKCTRNGRQLWKLAARRISCLVSVPILSWHNLIGAACQWIHYVNSYDDVLSLVGYSADHFLKRYALLSHNKRFLSSVKHNWEVISDIEKELPAEAIAQARRVARYRAALNARHAEDSYVEPFVCSHFIIFLKILPLLAFIWKVISIIFHSIVHFFFLTKFFAQESKSDGRLGIVSEKSCPQSCFILSLEKILITVYPTDAVQPVDKKVKSHIGISYSDFISFCFSIDELLLTYIKDIFEWSLTVSCGQLMVKSSPFMAPTMESGAKNFTASVRRHRKGRVHNLETVLWGEPAQMFILSESSKSRTAGHAEGACLETLLGEMWLSWKRTCMKFEESNIKYHEHPCIMCEIKSFLTYPGLKNPDSGFWKCSLTVGKLNLSLGYVSILSMTLLLRQIQCALHWTEDKERVISRPPQTIEDPPEISLDSKYESYASGMKMALFRMLPEKHIQLGAFIAGPNIQVSLRKVGFDNASDHMKHVVSRDDFHLGFDVHNIELVVWPASKSDFAPLSGSQGSDDAEPDSLTLQEPQIIDIAKPDNEKYTSHGLISFRSCLRVNGLNAYLGDSAEKQLLVLKPVTVHLSSFRECVHSFGTTVTAFSAALYGMATGFTIMSFMDELCVFFQVVEGSYSAVSYALGSFHTIGYVPFKEQDMVSAGAENAESTERDPLICNSTLFLINGSFKLKLVDIILHNSRVSNKVESSVKGCDASSVKNLAGHDLLDCGIWICVHKTFLEISCEERKMEVLMDLSGIQTVLLKSQDHIGKIFDHSVPRNMLLQSHNCLCEISLSSCKFTLWLGPPWTASSSGDASDTLGGSTSMGNTSYTTQNSPSTSESEKSSVQSRSFVQKLAFGSIILPLTPSRWILINLVLGDIFMARSSVKSGLIGAHQCNKLLSSLSVGGNFQTISWGIQGGILFLETTALAMFIQCIGSFFHHFTQSSVKHTEIAERNVDIAVLNDHFSKEYAKETLLTSQQTKWGLLEAFTIDVSQFSLVLVVEEESGRVWELVFEFDIHMNLELANMRRKFILNFSRLSILSQVLQVSVENEIEIPHFSSVTSNELSSRFASGDPTVAFQHRDMSCPVGDATCSRDPVSQNGFSVDNCVTEVFHLSHKNEILKHLGAFISVELNQVWVGSVSVSGFDMAISLSELQMILSMISSFSGVSSKETTGEVKQSRRSSNQETDNSLKAMVPDGAIVAIQDVHQHMYFAVEGGENKYTLAGAIHYSLVGEKALFREILESMTEGMYKALNNPEAVALCMSQAAGIGLRHMQLVGVWIDNTHCLAVKHHNQRIWRSSVLWFSLISLHAKNDLGEPLRLNYHPGSGFVDISGTNDSWWALWRALSCEPESYKGDIDWEPYNQLVKDTLYLVNKKNDCAVAFVDGVPEFVKKPGNPFKLKVFGDFSVPRGVVTSDRNSVDTSGTHLHPNAHDEGRTSGQSGSFPCIDITIDEVTLTILHELLDTKDRFPLLRGCISNTHLIVQILSSKTRVMSTSRALLCYFDAQRNLWRELVHPVEICTFYRYSFQIQGSETVLQKVPIHIYCRTKELEVSLTELSLDTLLFVIGELNLAGPYSVRSSMILANCCKVENQSGLNLLCHFYNKQSVTVGRKQSASIFLRHSALADLPPEIASVVSIQLSVLESFTTSSIHLSLLEAQVFAWRTRIVSLQDSRTYPGPFIVVDISRKHEDGLSIVVSPLIRIHNETKFSMELKFRRPEQKEDEYASVLLKTGDTIDDSIATFDAVKLSGGIKKALMSLSVGNFLFSFRPEIPEGLIDTKAPLSVEWSDELKGGKAVRLSGIFDKLSYGVRKALSVESVKCSFSSAHCTLKSEDVDITTLHFLIQSIGRDVPITQPDKSSNGFENRNSPIALQEQKEIFLLPTMRVTNLLHSEISVLLTETDQCNTVGYNSIGKQATIPCGSTVDFYANPAIMYFTVTLTDLSSSCKPVNSSDWVKKLLKHKNDVYCLDIDLDFGCGKYFASLRLSRGHRGILEAAIYTSFTLKNDTDFTLFFFAPNQKSLSRDGVQNFGSSLPPECGLISPPKSTKSWFLKSHKVQLKLLEDHASEAMLDLDALSGLTEINLETDKGSGVKHITKFGVSMGPSTSKVAAPSQTVTMVPRHVVFNESEEVLIVRQFYLENDMAGMIRIDSKQRTTLQLRNEVSKRREYSLFENYIRNHRNDIDNSLIYIQFRLNESELGWSGPLCIASLGRFFLKFRKQSNQVTALENSTAEFAAVHVVEEGSTLVVHFHKPPNINLPYRIENRLHGASLTYYQKDSSQSENLGPECSVDYVWDDLTLPHKLVVLISGMRLLREINLDKVRAWKPFSKLTQHRGLASHLPLDKKSGDQRTNFGEINGMEMVKLGYEVYAEGPTRVLRICEFSDSHKEDAVIQSSAKIQLRVPHFAMRLLEHGKQDANESEASFYTPVIVARLGNINLDSLFTDRQKYNRFGVQSLNVDQKWVGAPYSAMLRRHQLDSSDSNDCVLKVNCVLLSTSSNVKQVKYLSIVMQPVDLNLDEETLMRIASFWRTSLSDSNTPSRRFYFDHFEIHPIKIIANFLPGDSYSSYNSAQETLRSLLHSVVKVPHIKNMVVELNGVLVTHALITMRELFVRCAQHYSWYSMRAIYIAKGSSLLPPGFASIFDDLASSSLDVFFDPSKALMNLPGFTLGTFKLISKGIHGKGFSGTKRYFGDLGKTLKTAGSNVLFATVTEISDSVLKGAETSGFDGMLSGFHQGILKLAMEPSLLGTALMGGGPDRKIKLDRSPGVDELYIEGYLQAMLDTMYRQEYLRVRVIDNQVVLKNLPPNSSLIDEIMDRVKGFLISKALLKGDPSTSSRPLRHLRGDSEWKIGPTVLTLCEHLFVSFAIRLLRKRTGKFIASIKRKGDSEGGDDKAVVPVSPPQEEPKVKFIWKWGIGKFVLSGILAYVDGRLCRCIPNPVARRIVSGFLLSFLDENDSK